MSWALRHQVGPSYWKAIKKEDTAKLIKSFQYSREDLIAIWQHCGVASADLRLLPTYSQEAGEWFDHPNDEKAYDIGAFMVEKGLVSGDYLVIDDEPLSCEGLLQVEEECGLTKTDAASAIAMLLAIQRRVTL